MEAMISFTSNLIHAQKVGLYITTTDSSRSSLKRDRGLLVQIKLVLWIGDSSGVGHRTNILWYGKVLCCERLITDRGRTAMSCNHRSRTIINRKQRNEFLIHSTLYIYYR